MTLLPPDMDILPPSDDHIFKTLLTHPSAKPVLISVVSTVIERPVVDVLVRNAEPPVTDTEEKAERLDVNCTVDGGDQIDVEMQSSRVEEDTTGEHVSFINKSIYYLTDLHSSQKSKGVMYRNLVRTYQVTFCTYPVFPTWPDFVSRFSLRRPNGEQLSDQINMVVVEMSKLSALLTKPAESMSLLEAWPIFFNFADRPEHRELINNLIRNNEEIKMASELLMTISQDEKERAHFRSRRMYETDQYSNLQTAIERGRREGRDEGRREGRDEGRREGRDEGIGIGRKEERIEILNLLDGGVSIDEIRKRLRT